MRVVNKLIAVLSMSCAMSIAVNANAGDAAAGKAKSAVCAACHGVDGIATIPTYPNIAGQNEAYLVESMKAYREKRRTGGQAVIMQGQSMALSDEDIADLAAYYASLGK